jgi:hypothetical protein
MQLTPDQRQDIRRRLDRGDWSSRHVTPIIVAAGLLLAAAGFVTGDGMAVKSGLTIAAVSTVMTAFGAFIGRRIRRNI